MYPQYPRGPYPMPFQPPQGFFPMGNMMPMGNMANMMYRPSLLQSMKFSLGQLSMSSTLRTAQKTLYTANQIIPIVNQLRPVMHNATTAFRVVKAVKQFDFDDIDEEIDKSISQKDIVFENMIDNEKAD